MEAKLINKNVQKMADAIIEANSNPNIIGIHFSNKRRCGMKAAIALSETTDAEFELIEQKKLPPSTKQTN